MSTNRGPHRFNDYFQKIKYFSLSAAAFRGLPVYLMYIRKLPSSRILHCSIHLSNVLVLICSKLSLLGTDKPLCLSTTSSLSLLLWPACYIGVLSCNCWFLFVGAVPAAFGRALWEASTGCGWEDLIKASGAVWARAGWDDTGKLDLSSAGGSAPCHVCCTCGRLSSPSDCPPARVLYLSVCFLRRATDFTYAGGPAGGGN